MRTDIALICFSFLFSATSLLAEWEAIPESSPSVLTNGATGWGFTVSAKGQNLTLLKYLDGVGTLDLSNVEKDTGYKVTGVGDSTFSGNASLTQLIAPDVVTTGFSSFSNCKSVTNITLSSALQTIGRSCFSGCSKLKSFSPLNMPNLTSLGMYGFKSCGALNVDMRMPLITLIPSQSFISSGITSLYAPLVTKVEGSAFQTASKLTNVVINSTSTIEIGAFLKIGSGANIYWLGKKAPTSIKKNSLSASGNRLCVYVRNGKDIENWKGYCVELRGDESFSAYLAAADCPDNRENPEPVVGILGIADGGVNAWLAHWSLDNPTLLTIR